VEMLLGPDSSLRANVRYLRDGGNGRLWRIFPIQTAQIVQRFGLIALLIRPLGALCVNKRRTPTLPKLANPLPTHVHRRRYDSRFR
jgi:hypothetical protein